VKKFRVRRCCGKAPEPKGSAFDASAIRFRCWPSSSESTRPTPFIQLGGPRSCHSFSIHSLSGEGVCPVTFAARSKVLDSGHSPPATGSPIYKTPTTYLGTYLILTRYTRGHPRFKFYTVTPGLQVPRWRFSHIPILSDNLKSAIMFGVSRTTRALRFNATRSFSSAPRVHAPAALKINADRLWKTLHQTCEWGAAHRYGEYVL
jgi:hypothetical protein